MNSVEEFDFISKTKPRDKHQNDWCMRFVWSTKSGKPTIVNCMFLITLLITGTLTSHSCNRKVRELSLLEDELLILFLRAFSWIIRTGRRLLSNWSARYGVFIYIYIYKLGALVTKKGERQRPKYRLVHMVCLKHQRRQTRHFKLAVSCYLIHLWYGDQSAEQVIRPVNVVIWGWCFDIFVVSILLNWSHE